MRLVVRLVPQLDGFDHATPLGLSTYLKAAHHRGGGG
jgi:hypothetical protein